MAEIGGLKELSAQLGKLKGLNARGLTKAGYVVLRHSKINSPVDTGSLRENSWVESSDDNVSVVFGQSYAYYQEVGTDKMQGKGYVSRAIEDHQQDILDAAKSGIEDEIKNV